MSDLGGRELGFSDIVHVVPDHAVADQVIADQVVPDLAVCDLDSDCPDDGNRCNGWARCTQGQCYFDPATAVECDSTADTFCLNNICVPTTGQCVYTPVNEAASCDLDNTCGTNYLCQQGACLGDYRAPSQALPLAPQNGAYTSASPDFAWREPQGDACAMAPTFHLQVDDSCNTQNLQGCSFFSPEVDAVDIGLLAWSPGQPLLSAAGPPAGTRYYWRVRACRQSACSAWSRVRYFEVGRVPSDTNGDGFSEAAVGAAQLWSSSNSGAFLYQGGPTALGAPAIYTEDGAFGMAVATCDLNGDGFSEFIVGTTQSVYVYRGASGQVATNPIVLTETGVDRYGSTLACLGDVNGDGFADFATGGVWLDGSGKGVVVVHSGRASLDAGLGSPHTIVRHPLSPDDYTEFGMGLSSAGDVNGDGFADMVVGAPFERVGSTWPAGRVFVFYGSATGIATAPEVTLSNPHDASSRFGHCVSAGDLNSDGYSDVLVSAYKKDGAVATSAGAVYLYLGGAGGLNASLHQELVNPEDQSGQFGASLAVLSHNDGPMLVVGANQQNGGATAEGNVFLFATNASGIESTPAVVLDSPDNFANGGFGSVVSAVGDLNGDGMTDLLLSAVDRETVFVFFNSSAGFSSTPSVVLQNPDDNAYSNFGRALASPIW